VKRGIPQRTKLLTASALLASLGVALLFVGSLIETLDLSMAAMASFFCLFAVLEVRGMYPWLIFAVTGILSIVLMPYSMGGWFYLLFFGFYPIFKDKVERLKKPVSWTLKIVVFNLALVLGTLVAFYIFVGDTEGKNLIDAFGFVFGVEEFGYLAAAGVYLLANVTFVIYDIALTRLIILFYVKIRKKLKFLK
jgi:hypothetical protein